MLTLLRAQGGLPLYLRVWLACVALTASLALRAEVPSSDASAIRAVIEAQLDAFQANDAARAFSYAAPGIQARFGTPANFLAMVQSEYPVVYHPASVAFVSVQEIDGQVSQVVQMTDTAGAVWMAVYTLERQEDRSWRISGCAVFRGTGRSARTWSGAVSSTRPVSQRVELAAAL